MGRNFVYVNCPNRVMISTELIRVVTIAIAKVIYLLPLFDV